jgi:hypothetical protein
VVIDNEDEVLGSTAAVDEEKEKGKEIVDEGKNIKGKGGKKKEEKGKEKEKVTKGKGKADKKEKEKEDEKENANALIDSSSTEKSLIQNEKIVIPKYVKRLKKRPYVPDIFINVLFPNLHVGEIKSKQTADVAASDLPSSSFYPKISPFFSYVVDFTGKLNPVSPMVSDYSIPSPLNPLFNILDSQKCGCLKRNDPKTSKTSSLNNFFDCLLSLFNILHLQNGYSLELPLSNPDDVLTIKSKKMFIPILEKKEKAEDGSDGVVEWKKTSIPTAEMKEKIEDGGGGVTEYAQHQQQIGGLKSSAIVDHEVVSILPPLYSSLWTYISTSFDEIESLLGKRRNETEIPMKEVEEEIKEKPQSRFFFFFFFFFFFCI